MELSLLTKIGANQHGVLTCAQAGQYGISTDDWRAMCRDQILVELFPGVARLAGAPDAPLSVIKAATLAFDASASHTSSAHVWGAPCSGTEPVHLVTANRNHRTGISSVVLHRPTDVRDIDAVVRQRISTTRPLRTLVDLGAVDAAAVLPTLRHFTGNGVLQPAAVLGALRDHRGRGRPGVRALQAALEGLALGSKPPDSWLEETMAQLFLTHHLPPFVFHAKLLGYEVDFLVVGTCVVIETDGWQTHGLQRDQFEFDREKDAILGDGGYIVRRFTWRQITRTPAWVAQRIEGFLRRWAPDVLAIP